MTLQSLPEKYSLPRGYTKKIAIIQQVKGTDLIVINKEMILAPYHFYCRKGSDEMYRGSFSNRTRELTKRELKAIKNT